MSGSTTITASYYNSATTGRSDDTGKGDPKTTAQSADPYGLYGYWYLCDMG